MKGLGIAILGLLIAAMPFPAFAYDWTVDTNVVTIEMSYIPDNLIFTVSAAAGACAAGSSLTWQIRGADSASKTANVQAVAATLMTALATSKRVRIVGNNSCGVEFIYLINS